MEKRKSVKKMWIIIVAVLLALVLIVYAAASIFLSKFDYWHPVLTKRKLAAYQKEQIAEGNVVFLGDSITDGCDLARFYPELTSYNRGISGDRTTDVLARIDSVYAAKPKVVVLLIGVNDVIFFDRKTEEIAADYKRILDGLTENCVGVHILCQSVYPTANKEKNTYGTFNERLTALNEEIIRLCDENQSCTFIDVRNIVTDEKTGVLNLDITKDGLHPNEAGYEVISAFLSPIIKAELNR